AKWLAVCIPTQKHGQQAPKESCSDFSENSEENVHRFACRCSLRHPRKYNFECSGGFAPATKSRRRSNKHCHHISALSEQLRLCRSNPARNLFQGYRRVVERDYRSISQKTDGCSNHTNNTQSPSG